MKICLFNETKSRLFHLFHKLIRYFIFLQQEKSEHIKNLPFSSHSLYVFEKTRVSSYKLCEEKKSIKLQMLALKK